VPALTYIAGEKGACNQFLHQQTMRRVLQACFEMTSLPNQWRLEWLLSTPSVAMGTRQWQGLITYP
jgi:hypothetical protein